MTDKQPSKCTKHGMYSCSACMPTSDTQIEWRPVVGFEGAYEVSNTGLVRSLGRKTKGRWGTLKTTPGRILKPQITNVGYLRVHLSTNGNKIRPSVHRLVAQMFIPNLYNKSEVNHIDSDRANNHVSNLEWVTHKENVEHGVKHGNIVFPVYERKRHICTWDSCDRLSTNRNMCSMHYRRILRKEIKIRKALGL